MRAHSRGLGTIVAQCGFSVVLLLTATSCILFQGSYTIQGRITAKDTGQSMAGVDVTLIKIMGNFAVIPTLAPAESIVTDSTGNFAFPVEARRAVYVAISGPQGGEKSTIRVPLDKVRNGTIRLEAKLEKDGHALIKWNDEEWISAIYDSPADR